MNNSNIAVGTYAGNTRQGANVVAVGGKSGRIKQVCVYYGGFIEQFLALGMLGRGVEVWSEI